MAEMEQPINQERESRIGRTVDIITSADMHRFTGFTRLLEFGGQIAPDAAAIFVDKDKPEGQQEVRIPMNDLTEAFERIVLGSFDDEKGTYSCQVGGQQKTVEGKRVSALSNHVLAWKLGPLK
jgi:hypothetical protein